MALEDVKSVNFAAQNTQSKPPKKKQYTRQIGGVTFTGDTPIKDEDIRVKNWHGQKIYSVFLSDDRKIVYSENTDRDAKIQYSGDGKHPDTNPNQLYIENMRNAEITGSPHSQDFIYLAGESYANNIIVDNDYPSLLRPRYHRQDHVCLGADTFSNVVKSGRADYIDMHWYDERQPDLDGESVDLHKMHEEIEQNEELEKALGKNLYNKHRRISFEQRLNQRKNLDVQY